jgi:hypothetical protein
VREIRKIAVQGQPGQKVSKTPSQINKPSMVTYIYNPSHKGGNRKAHQSPRPTQGKNMKSYLKNKVKKGRGVAQVVEHLPSKRP